MAPKQTSEADLDPTASTLLLILAHQSELKMDNAALGPILGLKDGKNVGRKIDSMIKPYGYKYEKGRIIANHGTAAGLTGTANANMKVSGKEESTKVVKKAVSNKGKKRSPSPEDEDVDKKDVKKRKSAKKEETKEEAEETDAKEEEDAD